MDEPSGSALEILRAKVSPSEREECIFPHLISRSARLPLSVTVVADDLAIRDLKERKLEINDLLTGCEDVFQYNRLNFSYDKRHSNIQPTRFVHSSSFSEYLGKGRALITAACIFEAQDLFLQSESSVLIFLTGHISVGNGRVNDVRPEFLGRGIMVIGTRSYNFWRDLKEQKNCIFLSMAISCLMLLLMTATPSHLWNIKLLSVISLGLILSLTFNLFIDWVFRSMNDYEYANYIFNVITHEQGHLFGLEHVDDEKSIMSPHCSKSRRFDESSKKKLQEALSFCS